MVRALTGTVAGREVDVSPQTWAYISVVRGSPAKHAERAVANGARVVREVRNAATSSGT
jgi:hypothetical protein